MTITIHFQWWMIPTIITLLAYAWALFWPFEDNRGFFTGIVNVFALLPASLVSLIAWIIAGILK